VAVGAAACTGGGGRPVAATTASSILPSADRIRSGQIRLGGPTSCIDASYCAAALSRVYGLNVDPRVVAMSTPAATVEALDAGAIDVGALPGSAVEVTDRRLVVLGDDRGMAPEDHVVPVLAGDLARAGGPALTAAVDAVSARLGTTGLMAIEQALAGGAPPGLAAQGWLQSHRDAVPTAPPGAPGIVIGGRADAASLALADLYAEALRTGGWAASVQPVDGGRSEELDALGANRVGMAVELSVSLLDALSGFTAPNPPSDDQAGALQAQLSDRGMVALHPAPATTGVVFAVNRSVAYDLGIGTLSDLSRATGGRPAPTTTTTSTTGAPSSTTGAPSSTTGAPSSTTGTPSSTTGAPSSTTGAPSSTTVPVGPGGGLAAPMTSLGVGATGDGVRALQVHLALLGYPRITATGTYDEGTRRAVMAFQADQGLIPTGEADPPTHRALATARPTTHPGQPPLTGDPGSVRVPTVAVAAGSAVAGPAGTVYLAFAGGPSASTLQILDLLQRHGVAASFFPDGEAAARHPDWVRAEAGGGDAVGTSAPPHDGLSPIAQDLLFRTVARTQDAVAAVTGRTPACLLAPYGATDPGTRSRAAARNVNVVLWDVDPQDWRRPGAGAIAAHVVASVQAGSVVLLHDGGGDRTQTVAAVGTILDALSSRGFGFAPLPDC